MGVISAGLGCGTTVYFELPLFCGQKAAGSHTCRAAAAAFHWIVRP